MNITLTSKQLTITPHLCLCVCVFLGVYVYVMYAYIYIHGLGTYITIVNIYNIHIPISNIYIILDSICYFIKMFNFISIVFCILTTFMLLLYICTMPFLSAPSLVTIPNIKYVHILFKTLTLHFLPHMYLFLYANLYLLQTVNVFFRYLNIKRSPIIRLYLCSVLSIKLSNLVSYLYILTPRSYLNTIYQYGSL